MQHTYAEDIASTRRWNERLQEHLENTPVNSRPGKIAVGLGCVAAAVSIGGDRLGISQEAQIALLQGGGIAAIFGGARGLLRHLDKSDRLRELRRSKERVALEEEAIVHLPFSNADQFQAGLHKVHAELFELYDEDNEHDSFQREIVLERLLGIHWSSVWRLTSLKLRDNDEANPPRAVAFVWDALKMHEDTLESQGTRPYRDAATKYGLEVLDACMPIADKNGNDTVWKTFLEQLHDNVEAREAMRKLLEFDM